MPVTKLTASDGHEFDAFRVDPEGRPRGAVVVLQEIFGVNDHIRAVTAMLAGCGYAAIAPAIFDRKQRDVRLAYTAKDHDEGITLARSMSPSEVILDIRAAIGAVAPAGKVGVVGYCLGGALTWRSAALIEGVSAAVSYYGAQIPYFVEERPEAPIMFHLGARDKYWPIEQAQAICEGVPRAAVHVYEADHGFACDHRAAVFDADASALALQRTLRFFAQHVG